MELLLVKPKVKSLEYDEVNHIEKFEISPLECGQASGVFGNSLRTTLMSNIPGYAVTNFQIGSRYNGKDKFEMKTHIFDTIQGVDTDLIDIFLGLKNCLFKLKGVKEIDVNIKKSGLGVVTAGDFACEGVTVINPDLKLFEIIDENCEIDMTLKVKEGRGYREEDAYDTEGWISVDGIFTPVVKVVPKVEEMRVNGESGYQKLLLTIETNGKITPKEALDTAIRIILEGYQVLREGAKDVIENEGIYFDVEEEEMSTPITYKNIKELNLSVRATNALETFGINNTGDFEKYTEKQIKAIDNLGRKTFDEIKKKLEEYNIELKK